MRHAHDDVQRALRRVRPNTPAAPLLAPFQAMPHDDVCFFFFNICAPLSFIFSFFFSCHVRALSTGCRISSAGSSLNVLIIILFLFLHVTAFVLSPRHFSCCFNIIVVILIFFYWFVIDEDMLFLLLPFSL